MVDPPADESACRSALPFNAGLLVGENCTRHPTEGWRRGFLYIFCETGLYAIAEKQRIGEGQGTGDGGRGGAFQLDVSGLPLI